jgi:hypothetical protein
LPYISGSYAWNDTPPPFDELRPDEFPWDWPLAVVSVCVLDVLPNSPVPAMMDFSH